MRCLLRGSRLADGDQGEGERHHNGSDRERDQPCPHLAAPRPAGALGPVTGKQHVLRQRQGTDVADEVGAGAGGGAYAVFDAHRTSPSLSMRARAASPREVDDLTVPRLMPIAWAACSSVMSR